MTKPAKNGKSGSNRGRRVAVSGQTTFNPGRINTAPVRRMSLRFRGSSTGQPWIITRSCLLSLCQASVGSSDVGVPLYTSARIRQVRLWPTSGNSDVDIEWFSDLGQAKHETRSYIGGPPSALVSSPPRDSRAAFWSIAGSQSTTLDEILFKIEAVTPAEDTNLLVDLDFEFTCSDAVPGSFITYTGGTQQSSTGIFYVPLDCISVSDTIGTWALIPVGVSSLFTVKPTTAVRTA